MSSLRTAMSGLASAALVCLACLVPAAAQAPAPATPPAQTTPSPQPAVPAQPGPIETADPFGLEVTLEAKPIVYLKGSGNWETAFETLLDAFKSVYGYLEKEGIKPAGPPMTIYTQTDDTGFRFEAAVPIASEPKTPPKGDIVLGKSPAGKALKFVHRGAYDAMDTTYEAITNYLDDKKLEAKDLFIEEYVTDPLKTPEDKLVIEIFVPTM